MFENTYKKLSKIIDFTATVRIICYLLSTLNIVNYQILTLSTVLFKRSTNVFFLISKILILEQVGWGSRRTTRY